MRKKKTAHEQILDNAEQIRKEIQIWKDIHKNGCSDPYWPDGTNMNLTRNHIIYAKQNIRELCRKSGESPPEEFYFPTPPVVDSNYFAKPSSSRAKRIKSVPDWECANPEPPGKKPFNDAQMSLF